jgi:phage-related protein
MQGVTFGNKHSYRAWNLLLKSKPVISPPKPKTKLIQVPGTNTVIDLTESLTGGEVKYEPRIIRCEFYVVGGRSKWSAVYSAVLNEIHGKKMKIIMDDDPNYYYLGRVTIDDIYSNESAASIVISAEVEPYKRAKYGEGRRL